MRIRVTAVAAAVFGCLALTGCLGGSGTAERDSTDNTESAATLGDPDSTGYITERTTTPWPFTVASGNLACADQAVTFITAEGTYGLNSRARQKHPGPDPIWAGDPNNPGKNISLEAVIDRGLELCK
ncbi:DUF2511 domain-containing protein [Streptomyces sp. NPDC088337]|uniref:DUF2511 domain-containing protein n=1 Tax=unclassified Streptomyces TaxID=2593676 RepID=UPI002DDACFA4|nr:DUF2511 domain-containing protein [Streptomyces sp. NBC_01788]WSB24893.1 YebY family protein [Streptomyces sp. NBC_01788]